MAGDRRKAADAATIASGERDGSIEDTATAPIATRPTERGTPAARATVGRYRLLEQLGAGGMGRVYRAHDPDLNREVAIKLLHPAAGDSNATNQLQRRMLREAQAMARLRHTNLAIVHDVGTDAGDVFIAMELIDGPTLKQWLETERPWRERLAMVVAAGRGLAAAHAADMVHRDFKPDNVLIDADGVPKVVDFGLARGVGELEPRRSQPPLDPDDALATPLTMTGALMGTPAYMAPEQHAGARAGAAADQFSLAVTTYEALYRKRPFDGAMLSELAEQTAAGAIAEPTEPRVPAAVFAALRRALAPRPDDRFANVDDLLAALERAARPRRWPYAAVFAAVGAAAIAIAAFAARGEDVPTTEELSGTLPKEAIVEVVHSNTGPIRECYQRALDDNPSLGDGIVRVRFFINGDGRVRRTEIDGVEGLTADVAACVGSETMQWKFPAPHGGGNVEVVYPFEFFARGDEP